MIITKTRMTISNGVRKSQTGGRSTDAWDPVKALPMSAPLDGSADVNRPAGTMMHAISTVESIAVNFESAQHLPATAKV